MFSAIRSSKLVSVRLKAVVCEFAILPEMFSSANDCARMPVTAVVSAPKIHMHSLHYRHRSPWAADGPVTKPSQSVCQRKLLSLEWLRYCKPVRLAVVSARTRQFCEQPLKRR